MDWGKQESRQPTLCEARACHNRSAPKEPWGAKVVSLLRGLSRTAPRFAKAVELPNARTLTATLLA